MKIMKSKLNDCVVILSFRQSFDRNHGFLLDQNGSPYGHDKNTFVRWNRSAFEEILSLEDNYENNVEKV